MGIKVLTEQKLRLDEGYLQINNQKIKLKSRYANNLNPNFNTITQKLQKMDERTRLKITTEQKGFLRRMLDDISKNKISESKINEGKQQELLSEKLIDNMENSECSRKILFNIL